MVTYYIDSTTNPADPQLIRQVNYPNYPAPGTPRPNPPQAIADNIENLSFSYDITGSNYPGIGVYPLGPGNVPTPVLPDTPAQIRAVNVFLAGRSESPYQASTSPQYLTKQLEHAGQHSQPVVHKYLHYSGVGDDAVRRAKAPFEQFFQRRFAVRTQRQNGIALITALFVLILVTAIAVGCAGW